jgi:RNA polymerase sigma-70 factor (ECF subfamily)
MTPLRCDSCNSGASPLYEGTWSRRFSELLFLRAASEPWASCSALAGERSTRESLVSSRNARACFVSGSTSNSSEPVHVDRDDGALLGPLREGDEQVFSALVDRWGGMMLRLALSHVENRAIAEEVVQEAWLTVLRSLDRFEGRSSLRTWILGIVVNLARSRARAERRSIALPESDAPVVDSTRFLPADHPRWPHHWAMAPIIWRTPEQELLAEEVRKVILDAIDELPAAQREVMVLRDLEGIAGADVCNVLGLTDTHQRVLLHRARTRVRNALERYFAAPEAT